MCLDFTRNVTNNLMPIYILTSTSSERKRPVETKSSSKKKEDESINNALFLPLLDTYP